jgi:hypothetical protein
MPERKLMQGKSVILLALCFLALSACAPRFSQVGPGKPIELSESEALVFGKIMFIENGEEKVPYGAWTRKPFPTVFGVESEKYYVAPEVEKDGSFYWKVPRGTYIISKVEYAYTVLPQVAFQAPPDAEAVYLGTLIIDVETKRIIAARHAEKINAISVVNEFDKAREALLSRNPGFPGRMEERLMVHDKSIPIDEGLLTRDLLRDIILILTAPPSPLWQQ